MPQDKNKKGAESNDNPEVVGGKTGELVRGVADELAKKPEDSVDKTKDVAFKTVEGLLKNDPDFRELTVRNLRELGLDVLVKLEKKYEGILMYAFTNVVDVTDVVDFTAFENYKKPKAGDKVKVDFMGNPNAESELGAADIFPPSVRKITVYSHGDLQSKRTSMRRIGLKGENVAGRGFFDDNGYIPVFSGDIVVIGGEVEPEKGVEIDFDKQFRKKDSDGNHLGLDEASNEKYEQSDEAKKDKDFMEKLLKKHPRAHLKKAWSNEEIDNLIESVDVQGVGKRVVEAIGQVVKSGYLPAHCWAWVNKVYRDAGVRTTSTIFRSLNYVGKDCGNNHAGPEMISKIRPGDWLFYNNKNKADSHGNHSAVFIKWLDEGNRIAQMASGYYNHAGRFHTVNLYEKPVVLIKKPTV